MAKVVLKELYSLQAELDKEIADLHSVSYETTHEKRLLSLLVELGELANETRCFKYWSNKGPSAKEIVMDEYADGLHFLLSLGIPLNTQKFEFELRENNEDLTNQFHKLYALATSLKNNYDLDHYIETLQIYLNLALSLGMNEQDIIDCYMKKLAVNHKRQETNY